ncbi:MAG: hypothetical protein QXK49_03045 [Candidatus Aenigmatarchaeota archaeon]
MEAILMVYEFTNSKGQKFWLHQKGKLFFFSKNQEGAIDLPSDLEVFENPRTKLPMVRKKK